MRVRARAARRLGGLGLAAPLAAALALSGCVDPGAGGAAGGAQRSAALAPPSGSEVTVTAGGREIRVAPPAGFCVDPDNVQPQGASTFVLIEDCALFAAGPGESGNAAPNLPIPRPALVNGIVTLSIGAGPLLGEGLDADADAAFEALATFLRSDAGRATAGMGGDASAIRILEERRVDDTLYLLVEDRGDLVLPVLGGRFWRGFTDVRNRAVIASLGVFEASDMQDAQKLAHLASVVAALKAGNDQRVEPEERRLAAGAPAPRSVAVASAAQTPAAPTARVAATAPTPRPASSAASAQASALASGQAGAASPPQPRASVSLGDGGTPRAPRSAPAARRRPRA